MTRENNKCCRGDEVDKGSEAKKGEQGANGAEKDNTSKKKAYSKVSERDYFIPFGVFSKDKIADVKASEVYIGRENERASLIQKLLGSGRHAAILVTGARGTGKTSLVNHCLNEYKNSYSHRYLRTNVGKSMTDYVMIFITLAVLLFFGVILSNLKLITSEGVNELTILLSLLFFVPAILAYRVWAAYSALPVLGEDERFGNKERFKRSGNSGVAAIKITATVVVLLLLALFSQHSYTNLMEALQGDANATTFISSDWGWSPLTLPCLILLVVLATYTSFIILGGRKLWARTNGKLLYFWKGCGWARMVASTLLLSGYIFSILTIFCYSAHDYIHWLISLFFLVLSILLCFIQSYSQYLTKSSCSEEKMAGFSKIFSIWAFWVYVALYIIPIAGILLMTEPARFIKGSSAFYLPVLAAAVSCIFNINYRTGAHPSKIVLLFKAGLAIFFVLLVVVFLEFHSKLPELSLWMLYITYAYILSYVIKNQLLERFLTNLGERTFGSMSTCQAKSRLFLERENILINIKAIFLCSVTVMLYIGLLHDSGFPGFPPVEGDGVDKLVSFEAIFLIGVVVLTIFIAYLEYDWIIRPGRHVTAEASLSQFGLDEDADVYDELPKEIKNDNDASSYRRKKIKLRSRYRGLSELTFPHVLFKFWIPVITVKINLGFDIVDHRTVIGAMLTGVRREYFRLFVSKHSYRVMSYYVVFIFLFVWLVFNVSAGLFDLTKVKDEWVGQSRVARLMQSANISAVLPLFYQNILVLKDVDSFVYKIRSTFLGRNNFEIRCSLAPGPKVSKFGRVEDAKVYCHEITTQENETDSDKSKGNHVYIYSYHLFTAVLLFFMVRAGFRRMRLMPYLHNLRKIDVLLEELSNTIVQSEKRSEWRFSNLFKPMVDDAESHRSMSQQPCDSRTIELKFMSLLNELQVSKVHFMGLTFGLPNPEITFVFDELDKLAEKTGDAERENIPRFRDSVNVSLTKRHMAIQKLMSDMKNIISSASAKFIFIGGRDLQDCWLSDQTDRNPLLTSIFDSVTYLPSLLVNSNSKNNKSITDAVYNYLYTQHGRAMVLMETYVHSMGSSSPFHLVFERRSMGYSQGSKPSNLVKNQLCGGKAIKFVLWLDKQAAGTLSIDGRTLSVEDGSKAKIRGWYEVQDDMEEEPIPWKFEYFESERLTLPSCCKVYLIFAAEEHCATVFHRLRESVMLDARVSHEMEAFYLPGEHRIESLAQDSKNVDRQFLNRLCGGADKNEGVEAERHDCCWRIVLELPEKREGEESSEQNAALCIYRTTPDTYSNRFDTIDNCFKPHFIGNFINFLAYRSQGNPKQLGELFASMVYPAGRVYAKKALIDGPGCIETRKEALYRRHSQNVLYFSDVNMVRIQLLSQLFEQLKYFFEETIAGRDDKVVSSIFYLSDFLFKFHRRAFAWDSLEKIDELADINRAPDIRTILQQIVEACKPLYFHQVLNGMYVFRFRSEISLEIEYISKLSPTEMAAFNFTLDESMPLKEFYQCKLKDGKGGEPALITSLGELYEYDEEFDSARKEYYRALLSIDSQLKEQLGTTGNGNGKGSKDSDTTEESSIIYRIMTGKDKTTCRANTSWAVFRLRLMLQIGMTYEQSKNLERAHMQYCDADLFASRIIESLIGGKFARDVLDTNFTHVLKHFNLLFQPLFAKAWVAEKLEGAVDTSVDIVEKEIYRLRKVLPFFYGQEQVSSINTSNSNIYLLMAELHNKTGDLYFFKGVSVDSVGFGNGREGSAESNEKDNKRVYPGYLFQAHYHYALSLHEVKEFIQYRVRTAKQKFSVPIESEYFARGSYPAFVYTTLASNLCDMSEATLARIDVLELMAGTDKSSVLLWKEYGEVESLKSFLWEDKNGSLKTEKDAQKYIDAWFGRSHFDMVVGRRKSASLDIPGLENKMHLLSFAEEPNTEAQRFMSYLVFCEMSYECLKDGGYNEDAIREYLKSVRTINQALMWYLVSVDKPAEGICQFLLSLACKRCTVMLQDLTTLHDYNLKRQRSNKPGLKYGKITCTSLEINAIRVICTTFMLIELAQLEQAIAGSAVPANLNTGEIQDSFLSTNNKLIEKFNGYLAKSVLTYRFRKGDCASIFTLNGRVAYWLMEELIRVYRYPILNRLESLNILLMYRISSKVCPGGDEELRLRAEELRELKQRYDAPMHFSEQQTGVTFYALGKFFEDKADENKRTCGDSIYWLTHAYHDLESSQQSYTMRARYYENISNLYYLYDDFNDRQRHYSHAIQMMGAELTHNLIGEIKPKLK